MKLQLKAVRLPRPYEGGDRLEIVQVQSLTRKFGELMAVNSISFSVAEGEIFGLLGPNGAGKTTTLKVLTTLLPPTSGRATVGGFDVVRESWSVRRMIGYVPQALSADGTLTGFENLLIFAKLYDIPARERKSRIHNALEFMGLSDSAGKLVRTYSGGMIRRLEIAQSMLHRPRVLFLDEPTIGLDPVARQMVWEHVEKLKDDFRTTVLLTTHYMEEADTLCNRVAIMHLGKIEALGSPEDLKASIGRPNATMDNVFVHYTGHELENGGGYRENAMARRIARRLG